MSDLKHEVITKRWDVLIIERMESGMTIKEWCYERNIKESQYYYWLKALRGMKLMQRNGIWMLCLSWSFRLPARGRQQLGLEKLQHYAVTEGLFSELQEHMPSHCVW